MTWRLPRPQDWCSLHQKDEAGGRSDAEATAFKTALRRMNLFYAHTLTTVFLMTEPGQSPIGHSPAAQSAPAGRWAALGSG